MALKQENHALTAAQFTEHLKSISSPEVAQKHLRYFKTGPGEYAEGDIFMGVTMGQIFALAKAYGGMPAMELEKLMESPIHELRTGAMSIMNQEVRRKQTSPERRKELYELYLRRHDRINNWDLVDLAAAHVVGGYLFDKPRQKLYALAKSDNLWERRTAIVSTWYFIKAGDLKDTFQLAEILRHDDHDLIHKATGWMLRSAGDKQPEQLLAFLDQYAATLPRTLLRYAIEKLDKAQRMHYMGLKRAG